MVDVRRSGGDESVRRETRHPAASVLASPYLWGALLTLGFYELIPHLPIYRDLAERYFCGHPLEYALAGMFFVGMAILGGKLLRLRSERAAFDACRLEPADLPPADVIAQARERLPRSAQGTQLAERLDEVSDYLRHRRRGLGLEEHLKYLDQLAGDRLHESFSLLQTITWAVPIIGFLGTVMGITLAIANIDPEVLDHSLQSVTGGLAVAFDTTALALSLSVVLVFAYYFVKRAEGRILARVEEFCLRRILPLFPEQSRSNDPLADAQSQAAARFLSRTEELLSQQAELWASSLEELRERWSGTLDAQQRQLAAALQAGAESTLYDHAEQMAAFRREFTQAYETTTAALAEQTAESARRRREADADLIARLKEIEGSLARRFEETHSAMHQGNMELAAALTDQIARWQEQLTAGTQAAASQQEALSRQTAALTQLLESGADVAALQQRLNENLEALRVAETFEQTMHSLSAAVHLLTAHARPKAA